MSTRTIIVTIAVAAALGVGGAAGYRYWQAKRQVDAPPGPVAVPVEVAPAEMRDLEVVLNLTGTMEADQRVTLASQVAGRVVAVLADEGDRVSAGQVVVRLDDSDFAAQVAQARAALQAAEAARGMAEARLELTLAGARPQERRQAEAAVEQARAAMGAAEARLTGMRRGARPQERAQAEQAVRQAQAALDHAEAELRRAEELYASGAIAAQHLDQARTQREVAQAQHQTALEQLDLVRAGPRAEEIAAAEDAFKQAQAALRGAEQQYSLVQEGARPQDIRAAREQVAQTQAGAAQARAGLEAAQAMLAKATVRSPLTGAVSARSADPGQSVLPGMPLLEVVDNRQVYVKARVSESEVRSVRPGQGVRVRVDAYPEEVFAGRVADLLPVAEVATRTFAVRVRLPNPGGRLQAGMFARCEVVLSRVHAAAVPRAAVVEREPTAALFVVRAGKAYLAQVALGIEQGDWVQVTAGLEPGERVVVAGQRTLRDGDPVAVRGGA